MEGWMLRVGTRAGQKEGWKVGRGWRRKGEQGEKNHKGENVTGPGGGGQSAEVRNLKSCEKRTRIRFCHFATICSSRQLAQARASSALRGRWPESLLTCQTAVLSSFDGCRPSSSHFFFKGDAKWRKLCCSRHSKVREQAQRRWAVFWLPPLAKDGTSAFSIAAVKTWY